MNNFHIRFGVIAYILVIASLSYSGVVINEIYYDPDIRTELVSFIELYNTGPEDIDISSWMISDGVEFQVPPNVTLSANDYIVIGQNPQHIEDKYDVLMSKICGPFQGRLSNDGETIELSTPNGQVIDEVEYLLGFPWPTVGDPIPENRPGTSHSIQLVNPDLDNNLAGSWRSGSPTPGERNFVFAENIPPHIRQVNHTPKQPASSQPVRITAKVTDPDGIGQVELHYQIVEPGSYIALDDSEYETEWESIAMLDDGSHGDEIAGDFIYTAIMPESVQTHRNLVRYRLTVSDLLGNSIRVPYSDDPQPNFAYFVYDGVPSWRGAVNPGETEPVTYSSETLSSIPVYHLISSKNEVERATWLDQRTSNDYPYIGTLVYDGVVYDHIRIRARGGVWRYAMGKNMWKFNMNRGHRFQARDNYGREYDVKWDKVNLGANIQQRNYLHRGEQGMFESVGFDLFNKVGVAASNTNFVHLRIIDEKHEDGRFNDAHPPMTQRGTQYDGDFWGLYLATEQVDGRFLDEHGLPEGNLYKIENFDGDIKNQNPYGVSDGSDLRRFTFRQRNASEDWWRENVNLLHYFSYRSIVECIHHYDIANGKNYYFYYNPETEKWIYVPWDLDLTWANNMFGSGEDQFMQNDILEHDEIDLEYQNRMREIRDLLYNPDQTWQLIDEYASFIYDPNGESFVDADRAMWDYHWVMSGQAGRQGYRNRLDKNKSGQGEFYQKAPSKDFRGMLKIMKEYVVSRGEWIDRTILNNDRNVPDTPTVTPLTEDFRIDDLRFETSDFRDPNGNDTFAAMKWRIAEVEPFAEQWNSFVNPTASFVRSFDRLQEPLKYEIHAVWESEEFATFEKQITIPPKNLIPNHKYRVRVKMKDEEGHWSHWSAPIQFKAQPPDAELLVRENLQITEMMYNPVEGSQFEYIELHNAHPSLPISLDGYAFTDGISYIFPEGMHIEPNGYLLLTHAVSPSEITTFRQFYGLDDTIPIIGPYDGNLNNAGEQVTLSVSAQGEALIDFEYSDDRGWPIAADGAGHSLVPIDSAMIAEINGSLDYGGNWRTSAFIGGSPGELDPDSIQGILINELAAVTQNGSDWIELYNPTSNTIHLGSWYLSDDDEILNQWPIPSLDISPGGFVSFDADTGFNMGDSGFGFNKNGEEVYLSYLPGSNGIGRVADAVAYEAQETGLTWGRHEDGGQYWHAMSPTKQQSNQTGLTEIVIDELMYHPRDNDDMLDDSLGEYIELYNPTSNTVNLGTHLGPWQIGNGVDYVFEQGISINPDERILLVSFDPNDQFQREAFFDLYDIEDINEHMYGPYMGNISNRGERIAIEKLLDIDPSDGSLAWGIVDEVIYFDRHPWTLEADGTGKSLQRVSQKRSGNDPLNWKAGIPTPGMKSSVDTPVSNWMVY